MNIGKVNNISFGAGTIKNVTIARQDGKTTKKDINTKDIKELERGYITYKNGDFEKVADKNKEIDLLTLAYKTLENVEDDGAYIDLNNVDESHRIDRSKKTDTMCFNFKIEGLDKKQAVAYCYEKRLSDYDLKNKYSNREQEDSISYIA